MKKTYLKILLFDGECALCTASVQFVLQQEKSEFCQFASLASEAGRELCRVHGISLESVKSIVLIQDGQVFMKSDAVFAITSELKGMWPLLGIFRSLPKTFLDGCYDFIARNRYRFFGKSKSCFVLSEENRDRFLG